MSAGRSFKFFCWATLRFFRDYLAVLPSITVGVALATIIAAKAAPTVVFMWRSGVEIDKSSAFCRSYLRFKIQLCFFKALHLHRQMHPDKYIVAYQQRELCL